MLNFAKHKKHHIITISTIIVILTISRLIFLTYDFGIDWDDPGRGTVELFTMLIQPYRTIYMILVFPIALMYIATAFFWMSLFLVELMPTLYAIIGIFVMYVFIYVISYWFSKNPFCNIKRWLFKAKVWITLVLVTFMLLLGGHLYSGYSYANVTGYSKLEMQVFYMDAGTNIFLTENTQFNIANKNKIFVQFKLTDKASTMMVVEGRSIHSPRDKRIRVFIDGELYSDEVFYIEDYYKNIDKKYVIKVDEKIRNGKELKIQELSNTLIGNFVSQEKVFKLTNK